MMPIKFMRSQSALGYSDVRGGGDHLSFDGAVGGLGFDAGAGAGADGAGLADLRDGWELHARDRSASRATRYGADATAALFGKFEASAALQERRTSQAGDLAASPRQIRRESLRSSSNLELLAAAGGDFTADS